MTPNDSKSATEPRSSAGAILDRLERRIHLSRLALLWERLWPGLALPLILIALFLAASWFGLWYVVPDGGRLPALGLFALALAASFVPLARLAIPLRREAIGRLDRGSGVPDRPVGALSDRLPDGTTDSLTRTLWDLHRERELARVDAVRVARPHPDLSRRDPWRMRSAVALVALVALVYAGPSALDRVTQAFRGASLPAPIPPRIDAWVTPPAYTGRPPVVLAGERRGEDGPLNVPHGSVLTLRVDRIEGVTVRLGGEALAGEEEVAAVGTPRLFRSTLVRDTSLRVDQGGRPPLQWRFTVEPDRVPTIALEGRVEQIVGGALRMRYRLEDDYGVAVAIARFERLPEPVPTPQATSLVLRPPAPPRPLYIAPEMPLSLPQARTRSGVGTTTRDLSNHPWAGARVRMTLIARDDAGQEGQAEPVLIELPQRRFERPLARAVIEQRRALAMDAEMRGRVATALDYLTLEPEQRIGDTRVYLGLRYAYYRLVNARDDDALREVVDQLWDVALLIEDGDLSAAQRALRDAQERLEQALERGATPEELRRLMEELRQALNEVMREMMQQALRDQREGRQREPQPGERVISQQDLERMMREIEELMRSGNRDAARNLMSQLRDMLQALRNARPSMQGQNGGGQQMLDELGNMIREQQRLMDRTFRERQQGRRQQQPGQRGPNQPGQRQPGQGQGGQGEPGEGDQETMGELQRGQQALRDQLQRFMDQLRQGGRDPNRPLGDAEGQMGEAEQQLGRRNPGDALGPQNRALDNLRRGAQQMAREQMGQGEGDPNGMPGQGAGSAGNQRRPNMNDPLQRGLPPDETTGSDVRVPDRADRQRAQEILEDVRRRLSDPSRPSIEMEYLQRLLRPF